MDGKWPADRVERRAVASLVPYARNARTHTPEQVAQVAASIREWGWTNPVLIDTDGGIIAGHARVMAAQSLGIADIPVMIAEGWSEAQRRAYVLADNQLALNSGWDEALLKVELADLSGMGFDLPLIGFGAEDLDRLLAAPVAQGAPQGGSGGDGDEDPADAEPPPPRAAVTRPGDLWCMGGQRLLCGDSTRGENVERVLGGDEIALLFTSPPYGNQRNYTTGGISDWDRLMQGVFGAAGGFVRANGQVLVNLGLIHREGEWIPYWDGWLGWMKAQAWRRFGLYCWDQGPGLPGDWNGRLAPAFELVFHFNRQARQANKIVPCKWAGTPNKGSGLRAADGTISEYQHAGLPVQDFRIPDNVLRLTRHKGRGIETEHPAVFPVVLPEFLMRTYTDEGDVVFEPFGGSGTSLLAAERNGRRGRAIELAPAYVDLAIARWRMLHPDSPVTLDGDGRTYDAVAAARLVEVEADAA